MKKKVGIVIVIAVCILGGFFSFQFYQAKKTANGLLAEAERISQKAGEGGGTQAKESDSQTAPQRTTPTETAVVGSPSQDMPSRGNTPEVPTDVKSPQVSTENYKAKMADTYNVTLAAMSTVKDTTYALKDRKISLTEYKASIQQAKKQFTEAQSFTQANPPMDPKLMAPYQEFLAGIILAHQSMDVVLNGLSALNGSSLYTAKDMGATARDKVVNAYRHF